ADRERLVDRGRDLRMLVLAGITHILRQIALADQHDADAGYLLQHLRKVADRALFLAHDDDEHFALGVQGPGVGAFVIGLLVETPVTRRVAGRIAALPRRLAILGLARPGIAAGLHGIPPLFDRRDLRPADAVDPDIEHLLGYKLVHLAAIRRDAHEGRDHRREAARFHDLCPVEHVLHAIAQRADVVGVMLHLEDDAVIGRRSDRLRGADLWRREGHEGRLAAFKGADRGIEARDIGHWVLLIRPPRGGASPASAPATHAASRRRGPSAPA